MTIKGIFFAYFVFSKLEEMISAKDFVFFTIDGPAVANRIKTASGFSLELVTGIDPGSELHHVSESGLVRAVPRRLSNELGHCEIKPEDKIYFHFHTVCEDNRHEIDGEVFYRVHYSSIYCRVRDGKIQPVNDFVLLEPIAEESSNVQTESGIWLKPEADTDTQKARIAHMSYQSYTEGLGIDVGDIVLFEKNSDIPIEIEGKKYFRMRVGDLMAKWLEETD